MCLGSEIEMPHQVILELPDEVYQPLAHTAEQTGRSVEAVAQAALAESVSIKPGSLLEKWVGFWSSGVPDAGLRHDEYLGKALYEELGEPGRD